MFQYTGPETYEIFWQVGEGEARILPEKTSQEALRLFGGEQQYSKQRIFTGELLALSTMLEVNCGSFFWMGQHNGAFWRLELLRPLENQLSLRLFRIRYNKDLCDILTRGITPLALLQSASRVERLLIQLDQRGCYRVISASEQLEEEFGLGEHDEVGWLVQFLLYHQSTALLDISLRTNLTLQITDIASYQGESHHLVITLVPINHQKRHVVVSLFFVDQETFYQIQLYGSSTNLPQQEGDCLGLAFFGKNAQGMPTLEHSNAAFRRLLPEDQTTEFFVALNARLSNVPGSEAHFCYRPSIMESYDCFASRTETGLFLSLEQDALQKSEAFGDKLTPREREIAVCLCSGSPLRYIASYCGISEGTVKKTASNIYRKLGVTGRVELLRLLSE